MRQSPVRFAIVSAVLVATMACNNSSSTPTAPATTTETFAGTLTVNGAQTYQFTVVNAGTITATLTTVGPDSTVLIGMSLGVWSGTSCSVGTGLALDQAAQGSVLTATVSAPGTLCLRMYDSGTLTASATYSVDVTHP